MDTGQVPAARQANELEAGARDLAKLAAELGAVEKTLIERASSRELVEVVAVNFSKLPAWLKVYFVIANLVATLALMIVGWGAWELYQHNAKLSELSASIRTIPEGTKVILADFNKEEVRPIRESLIRIEARLSSTPAPVAPTPVPAKSNSKN